MINQACSLSQPYSRQQAYLAQAFQELIGVDLSLSCSTSPAWQRWYTYEAISEFAAQYNIETLSAVAAGTAYTMTNAYAALDFGTTDPIITFVDAGTYLITANVQFAFTGATFAANQALSIKLRRTNNTPADIGTARSALVPIMTTTTLAGPSIRLEFLYSAAAGDVVTIQGLVSATPSAGTVTATQAEIIAVPNR